jgi:hypothetical protein
MSHRISGGDGSPEPCYGNATRRVSKGARKPAEDSDPKTAFSMLWHDMYPHVIVSLEPGDAVVFWQDVMYGGVAFKEDCNYKCFISVRPECWGSLENAIFPVFVTGRQACWLASIGSRAKDPLRMRRRCDAWGLLLKNRATST